MRHKHADLIHAWAEGAEIERYEYGMWIHTAGPRFRKDIEYRIKPEKKPDVTATGYVWPGSFQLCAGVGGQTYPANTKCTFCGETGKLIKAEVL